MKGIFVLFFLLVSFSSKSQSLKLSSNYRVVTYRTYGESFNDTTKIEISSDSKVKTLEIKGNGIYEFYELFDEPREYQLLDSINVKSYDSRKGGIYVLVEFLYRDGILIQINITSYQQVMLIQITTKENFI